MNCSGGGVGEGSSQGQQRHSWGGARGECASGGGGGSGRLTFAPAPAISGRVLTKPMICPSIRSTASPGAAGSSKGVKRPRKMAHYHGKTEHCSVPDPSLLDPDTGEELYYL